MRLAFLGFKASPQHAPSRATSSSIDSNSPNPTRTKRGRCSLPPARARSEIPAHTHRPTLSPRLLSSPGPCDTNPHTGAATHVAKQDGVYTPTYPEYFRTSEILNPRPVAVNEYFQKRLENILAPT
jgi:hypothetical protein